MGRKDVFQAPTVDTEMLYADVMYEYVEIADVQENTVSLEIISHNKDGNSDAFLKRGEDPVSYQKFHNRK